MTEWKLLSSDEIAKLDRRCPVIIPLGLIEAHGPHLAVSVDLDTADYFSRRVAEGTDTILAPMINYGYADEMRDYPGTIGVTADTLAAVYTDVATHFCQHGFTRLVFFSGHGANKIPFDVALPRIWKLYPEARIAYWNYWTEAGFSHIHHADKAETEIALAVGTRARLDHVRDFHVKKPWYRVRSRYALDPASGGINGEPSKANGEEGRRMGEEIVKVLTEKIRGIATNERVGS